MVTRSGTLVKRKRELMNVSQIDLANKIGVSGQHLCNWERGAALIPAAYIKELCKELKLSSRILVDKTMEDIREKYYGDI